MECQKDNNKKNCPCTYTSCPRRGLCCECIRHHIENDELPACAFSKQAEATYDRSFGKFIEDRS